jgi:ribosomal-protein-alanine N-acetyltransferase
VWLAIRAANLEWLAPWEATPPQGGTGPIGFGSMVRNLRRQARKGQQLPFVVTYDDDLVGQLTVAGITYGSLRSAHIGYWVDAAVAGRGVMPTAVALATDHCFKELGLHRVEVNIRPENAASLRVVEKLGFRPEGRRLAFLHIAGGWRDHLSFALTAEEVPEGLLARWHASGGRAR